MEDGAINLLLKGFEETLKIMEELDRRTLDLKKRIDNIENSNLKE